MIWLFWGILIALAVLVCAWLLSGLFLFRRACRRCVPGSVGKEENPKGAGKRYFDLIRQGVRFCGEHFPEEVWIRKDELWQHAFWVDNGSDRTAVVVHGYGGHALDRYWRVPYYTARGFNVLLPDLRAHGSSEGRWIGFGAPEGSDVCEWVRWLRKNAGKPQRVLLDGVSMGAASVLIASGAYDLPELRLVLADCGFTSAWDEFRYLLRKVPGLLRTPLLLAANLWNRAFTGFNLRSPSALEAAAHSRVPTMFVHGQKDDFVPPEMSERLFAACAAPKELLRVKDAGHALSFAADEAEYTARLDGMIQQYIPPTETEV